MSKNKIKGKKSNRIFKIFLAVLITITLLLGGTAVWGVNKFRTLVDNSYTQLPDGENTGQNKQQKPSKELESFHILLLGVDSRDGDRGRSDTIIVATVNPHTEQILLTSLPRDTYAKIPGYGSTKINHAMAHGGVSLVKDTVEQFLDIEIDHYMTIDFKGFQKAIDVLGRVTINVEKDMRYRDPTDGTNINIKKGLQELDGKNSLDYVRFRTDSEADYGRMRRQQEFIRAVVEEMTQFSNVTRVIPFIEAVSDGIETDVHRTQVEALVKRFFGVRGSAIQSESIESRSYQDNDGIWFVEITASERDRVSRVLEEFKAKKE
jgi:LCP family protein required for cell wall assembly